MSPPFCSKLVAVGLFLLPLALSAGCGGGSAASPDGGTGAAGTGATGTGGAGTGGAGTGTAGTGGAETGAAGTGGTVDPNAVVGAFTVKLLDQTPGATQVSGRVNDHPTHELVIWEQMAKDGACTFVKPRIPFCSAACVLPNACIEDDTCVNNELTPQKLGTVTFKGLKTAAGASMVVANGDNNIYQTAELFAFPPFEEGDDVSVESTGDVVPAFSIHAKGIAPLALAAGDIVIDKSKPLTLTWTPKGASSDATIHVSIDISHHGGTKGKIECDAPDTGSLTIAATLITQLYNLGFSGYPSIDVTRSSVGTTSLARGKVQLNVIEVIQRNVTIPGLVSCNNVDDVCPMGQTCQADLKCK